MRLETGQYFYAMELIEGETLEDRVRRAGPLDARTTIGIAQQVISALAAAEKHGLVHRDLKPANLMLINADDPEVIGSDQARSKRRLKAQLSESASNLPHSSARRAVGAHKSFHPTPARLGAEGGRWQAPICAKALSLLSAPLRELGLVVPQWVSPIILSPIT
jgi:serine/threonine protein kinase